MCLTCTLVHRSWTGLEWQTRLLEASLAFDIWMILSRLIFWLRSNIKCKRIDLALVREPNDRKDSKQRTWLAEMTSFWETQWQGGNSENASKGWKVHSFVCYQPGGGLLCSHFDASRASAKVKRVLCIFLSGAIQEDLLIQNIIVEFPQIDNMLQAMWFWSHKLPPYFFILTPVLSVWCCSKPVLTYQS